MLELLRAWDLVQEDILILDPEESLASAVKKLLERLEQGRGTPCAIVQDAGGRFLGTLSTHRALRAMGGEVEASGAFRNTPGVDEEKAVHAACHMAGGRTVRQHMYTGALEIPPRTPVHDLLRRFAGNTAHFIVVTEAGRALGLLELDDVFKIFAREMLNSSPPVR
jgi:CBS-domain-containing membrane protein